MAKPTPREEPLPPVIWGTGIRPGTVQAYARWLNGSMGRKRYRRIEELAGRAGRLLAWRLQRAWGVEWRGAAGHRHRIRSERAVPPEMLLWGIGLVCVAWGADIYQRKARDRRGQKMLWLYHRWMMTLRHALCEIEREVWSKGAEGKHREWLRFVRRARTDPRYNWRTNRIESRVKRGRSAAKSPRSPTKPGRSATRKKPGSFAKRMAKQSR